MHDYVMMHIPAASACIGAHDDHCPLHVRSAGDYYEEYFDGLLGRSLWNRWVVYGYVDSRTRVVRSSEGVNYGR